MKKKQKFFTIVVLFITMFISGCSKGIKEIDYDKFSNLINEKKDFILYVGSASCHNCNEFSPKFEEVINENKIDNVYYIDLDKLKEEEKNKFNKIINISGTPTVAFITAGEEESSFNRINGNVNKEKIITRLKANDYIK